MLFEGGWITSNVIKATLKVYTVVRKAIFIYQEN